MHLLGYYVRKCYDISWVYIIVKNRNKKKHFSIPFVWDNGDGKINKSERNSEVRRKNNNNA